MTTKPIDKRKKQIEEQVFYNIMKIVQEYPQYSIAQHILHVFRRKGDVQDPYFWSDEKLLKKFEDYKDELDRELTSTELEETTN
jgi:hypothetical protein